MKLPYLFTSTGREEVRRARETQAELLAKKKLGSAQKARLDQAITITRRAFMQNTALSLGALAVAGGTALKLMEETDDPVENCEGPERFVRFANEINQSRLGTARWTHPAGASDEHPVNPVMFVGFDHGSPSPVVPEARLQMLHRTYQIVVMGRRFNLKKFNLEGTANIPHPLEELRTGDRPMTAREARIFLRNYANFRDDMRQNYPNFPQIQAHIALALSDGDLDCRGLDDPAKEQERLQYMHETYQPALQRASGFFHACDQRGEPVFERNAQGRIVRMTMGGEEMDMQGLEEVLRDFLEVTQHDIIVGRRDRYMAQHLHNRDLLLCGPFHIRNVRQMMVEQGKSFCTVHVTGNSLESMEDASETIDFRRAQHILNELRR